MFPTSLPKQFIAWEGEAPAEPLHRWLGRSLALPKVSNGIDSLVAVENENEITDKRRE